MTKDEWIEQIADELGQADDERFALRLSRLWSTYSDKTGPGLRLRYLYTKRHALRNLLGGVWKDVNWKEADTEQDDDQQTRHLQAMHDDCTEEITTLEAQRSAVRPKIAPIATTAPIGPDPGRQDANDRRYRGDPYRPPFLRP